MGYLKSAWYIVVFGCCIWLAGGTVFAQNGQASLSAKANQEPLWEANVSAIALAIPHYVGSDDYYFFAVPLPYFIYRGEIFKSDRDGLRGLFFRSDRFETDISLAGNLPVSSDNNKTREGMPELNALGEIGPALRYYLYRQATLDSLYLQTAWRGAFSVEFNGGLDVDTAYCGQRYTLDLMYQNKSLFENNDLSFNLSAGLSYADNILNGYFYDVQPKYATPDRVQYNAGSGYAGCYLSVSIYKELSRRWAVGGFIHWQNINGAVFENSPLVRSINNLYVGTYVTWKFAQSKEIKEIAGTK